MKTKNSFLLKAIIYTLLAIPFFLLKEWFFGILLLFSGVVFLLLFIRHLNDTTYTTAGTIKNFLKPKIDKKHSKKKNIKKFEQQQYDEFMKNYLGENYNSDDNFDYGVDFEDEDE